MANTLALNRVMRGYFTLDEQIAVRQLQEIQNDLDVHKADINREIHDEIGKELFKTIIDGIRHITLSSVATYLRLRRTSPKHIK